MLRHEAAYLLRFGGGKRGWAVAMGLGIIPFSSQLSFQHCSLPGKLLSLPGHCLQSNKMQKRSTLQNYNNNVQSLQAEPCELAALPWLGCGLKHRLI